MSTAANATAPKSTSHSMHLRRQRVSLEPLGCTVEVARHDIGAEASSKADTEQPDA